MEPPVSAAGIISFRELGEVYFGSQACIQWGFLIRAVKCNYRSDNRNVTLATDANISSLILLKESEAFREKALIVHFILF